jgi:PHD/YefM family antitoxin component YafN of YafNO toxin-antitoxin module
MPITTISSSEFSRNVSGARKAAETGPVFITEDGRSAHVLLTIDNYQSITDAGQSLAEALAMPEGVDEWEEFDPPRLDDLKFRLAHFD